MLEYVRTNANASTRMIFVSQFLFMDAGSISPPTQSLIPFLLSSCVILHPTRTAHAESTKSSQLLARPAAKPHKVFSVSKSLFSRYHCHPKDQSNNNNNNNADNHKDFANCSRPYENQQQPEALLPVILNKTPPPQTHDGTFYSRRQRE
jgi:hypothetical protein